MFNLIYCSECETRMRMIERDRCNNHTDCVYELWKCPRCGSEYSSHLDVQERIRREKADESSRKGN